MAGRCAAGALSTGEGVAGCWLHPEVWQEGLCTQWACSSRAHRRLPGGPGTYSWSPGRGWAHSWPGCRRRTAGQHGDRQLQAHWQEVTELHTGRHNRATWGATAGASAAEGQATGGNSAQGTVGAAGVAHGGMGWSGVRTEDRAGLQAPSPGEHYTRPQWPCNQPHGAFLMAASLDSPPLPASCASSWLK